MKLEPVFGGTSLFKTKSSVSIWRDLSICYLSFRRLFVVIHSLMPVKTFTVLLLSLIEPRQMEWFIVIVTKYLMLRLTQRTVIMLSNF